MDIASVVQDMDSESFESATHMIYAGLHSSFLFRYGESHMTRVGSILYRVKFQVSDINGELKIKLQ